MHENGHYELSASYMNGLVKAVRDAGYFDGVAATLAPELVSAYQRPAVQPWWDARFAEQLAFSVSDLFGDVGVEQVGYGVVAEAIGPLVAPRVQQLLQQGGQRPELLFASFHEFVGAALRPVTVQWRSTGGRAGSLEVQYPREVRREILVLWRGALRYVFELCARQWVLAGEAQQPAGTLRFELSWS